MPTRSKSTRGPRRHLRHLCLAAGMLASGGVLAATDAPNWLETGSGIEFVRIDGGCFDQGADIPGITGDGIRIPLPRADEVPRRRVCVAPFWLSRTEVTRAQWARIMVAGSEADEPNRPRADITWHEAQDFVAAFGLRAGSPKRSFRLPTEAEWEYACHAGSYRTPLQVYGEDRMAWMQEMTDVARYRHPSVKDPKSSPVAQKKPNAWGLFDMLGNVWEWTADRYDAQAYRRGAQDMVATRGDAGDRVVRGGSYMSDIPQVRCGVRNAYPSDQPLPVIGLRLLMEEN